MAREEHDKEDLLREATALVERIEWRVDGFEETVVAGFRRSGAFSVFFSADPVYQFNEGNELRRAYLGGKLIKAERGSLASLNRVRTESQVELRRTDLSEEATAIVMREMEDHLDRLQAALEAGDCETIGQVPDDADVAARVSSWLSTRPRPIQIADRPNV